MLNTLKFDCMSPWCWRKGEDEKCVRETSALRNDLLPLVTTTITELYRAAFNAVRSVATMPSPHKTQHLDVDHVCSHLSSMGIRQSLVLKLAHLYDKSDETRTYFSTYNLLEMVASTLRMPEEHAKRMLVDFIVTSDSNYTYDDCGIDRTITRDYDVNIPCCEQVFRTFKFSNDAIFFTYATAFAMTRFLYPSVEIPLGSLLTRSYEPVREILGPTSPIDELENIVSKFRSLFLAISGDTTTTYVNRTLPYFGDGGDEKAYYRLSNLYNSPFWSECKSSYYESEMQFCASNVSSLCCALEIEISKDIASLYRVMKYMMAPAGKKANGKGERRDRLLVKNSGYQLVDDIMSNNNPVFLACKYEKSPFQSNCNLFRNLFTTEGIGHTFNNEAFYKLLRNNADNNAFFKEIYQLEGADDTYSPRNISLNGKKRSFEFILNHIKDKTRSFTNKLSIHDPYTIADPRNEAIDLEPGIIYDISVTPSVTVTDEKAMQLGYTQRKCLSERENNNLEIFERYSQSACLLECQLKNAIAKCNCTAWNYPRLNQEVNICMFYVAKFCFEEQMEELDPKSCACPNDCHSTHYSVAIKATSLNVDNICFETFSEHQDLSQM